MSGSNGDADSSIHLPEQIESLLPHFATRPYSHLPTPQSPNTLGRYLVEHPPSPETPVPYNVSSSITPSTPSDKQRHGSWKFDKSVRLSSTTQQYATPESSPLFQHIAQLPESNSATPRYRFQSSTEFSTPKQSSCLQAESVPNGTQSPLDSSPTTAHSLHSSALSSPFMGRMILDDHNVEKNRSNLPIEDADVFSAPKSHSQAATALSTPPISPPRDLPSTSAVAQAGGEMERIRNAMRAEALNRIQEAEIRRPDYLKRAKRTFAETEPVDFGNDPGDERWPSIGVMDSPQKGRRLKLFQETSDESFEESLMAGGYGRYRTADWVRQPQPISIPPSIGGSSVVASLLEKAEETPPTEKEVKKQRRLAAFRLQSQPGNLNVAPIELEGKGRVLVEIQPTEPAAGDSPETSPSKRKAASRRKKKVAEGSIDRKLKSSGSQEERLEKPNWPDTEFPWRLRTEERIEEAKAEKEERFKWIERYLDRDSDEDDDEQLALQDEQATSAILYDRVSNTSYQVKMGRGKMIPLSVAPNDPWNLIPKRPFPVDPADARQALLSKKSVRTLSYRQQKRRRQEEEDEEDEEVLCICHGKDDGRELVQCDTCQTWYHLECIGIKNIAELGREEDPWFCGRCNARNRSPSVEVELPTSEPTFVPTEPPSSTRRSFDATFFHLTAPESPTWTRMPKTPTRGVHSSSDFSRPSWNWMDPSRPMPSTPHQPLAAHKIYSTPGAFEAQHSNYYDESPFDPTSTPSRGIKLPVAFATPKLSAWPPRSNPLLQTPSRAGGGRAGTNRFHVPHSASLDEGSIGSGQYSFARVLTSDESPIRRNKSSDATFGRRRLLSPTRLPP